MDSVGCPEIIFSGVHFLMRFFSVLEFIPWKFLTTICSIPFIFRCNCNDFDAFFVNTFFISRLCPLRNTYESFRKFYSKSDLQPLFGNFTIIHYVFQSSAFCFLEIFYICGTMAGCRKEEVFFIQCPSSPFFSSNGIENSCFGVTLLFFLPFLNDGAYM